MPVSRRLFNSNFAAMAPLTPPVQAASHLVSRSQIVTQHFHEAVSFRDRYANVRTAIEASPSGKHALDLISAIHKKEVPQIVRRLKEDEIYFEMGGWVHLLPAIASVESFTQPFFPEELQRCPEADKYY